jgi:hypothetical protein
MIPTGAEVHCLNKKTFMSIGLLLVILAASVWIYNDLAPKGIDPHPYQMLAAGAADETAKLLHNSGRVVLVDADFGAFKILAPTTKAEIESFKKVISKNGLKTVAIEKVAIVPPSMGRVGIFMRPGQMEDLLARHADADAIVTFVGLAGPEDFKNAGSRNGKPKLVLVSNYESADETLLRKGIVQLAIVQRAANEANEDKTIRSGKEWFERHYEALTPERVDEPEK